MIVIDTRTNKTKHVTKEEYREKDYYVSPCAGKFTVYDISKKTAKNVSIKEYYESSNLVFHRSKIFKIYDENDNLIDTIHGNFEKTCKKKGYPFRVLVESYLNNGRRIYGRISNKSNPKIKFKGWYATRESFDTNNI